MDILNEIQVADNGLSKIDITSIARYSALINEIHNVNKTHAPWMLTEFIKAHDVTAFALASAIRAEVTAKSLLDSAEAIAFLDNASKYLADKSIKDTAGAREQYVNIDPAVIQAKDLKAKTEALVTLLKNKLAQFRMAHDDVKRVVYGDNYQTPHEGM